MEELEEMGVESIRDIPDDFELTEIQRRAADQRADGGAVVQPGTRRSGVGDADVPAVLSSILKA